METFFDIINPFTAPLCLNFTNIKGRTDVLSLTQFRKLINTFICRFLVPDDLKDANLTLFNEKRGEVEVFIKPGVSTLIPVFASSYSVRVNGSVISSDIEIGGGGVYAVLFAKQPDGNIVS